MASREIFRAYDIRGVYGKDLDEGVMELIGKAVGTFLSERGMDSIALGRDIRASSKALSDSFARGAVSAGMRISDTGETSSGVTLFAARELGKDLGAYVTASHLGPEWNGIKFYYGDGEGMAEEEIQGLHTVVESGKFASGSGSVESVDFKRNYIDFLRSRFEVGSPKAVLDCGGGSACLVAPELLDEMGVSYEKLFCDVDPGFSGRPSDPIKAENISKLVEKMKHGYDIGLAFDGDADRLAVVDDEGYVLSAELIGMIIAKDMLVHGPGTVIATLPCSMAVEEVLEPLGAQVIRTKVGHTFLTQAAKEHSAIIGFEDSGHMLIPQYVLFDDAMVVSMKIMEVMKSSGKKLSELRKEIPHYPKGENTVKCDDSRKFRAIEGLGHEYAGKYESVGFSDGIRIGFKEAWVLIRASNTGPKIRVTVEARSKGLMESLLEKFTFAVEEAAK